MPAKNRVKTYENGGIYYIYNRGIDGKLVFREASDFEFFKKTMLRYLDYRPKEKDARFKAERPYILRHREQMNLKGKMNILAYCLSSTGVKFIIKQIENGAMTQFMRRCMTNYVMYYNRKYQRRGVLFEGTYRAVLLKDPENIIHLSRWVHLNKTPKTVRRFGIVETSPSIDLEEYLYSSLGLYISSQLSDWVETGTLSKMFVEWNAGRWKDYRSFVADPKVNDGEVLEKLGVE
jgi:putative transposase